jgi:hypothetical protein
MHSLKEDELIKAATLTEGLAGAELENIVNLAALQSVRKAKSSRLDEPNLNGQDFLAYVTDFIEEKKRHNRGGAQAQGNPYNQHFYR